MTDAPIEPSTDTLPEPKLAMQAGAICPACGKGILDYDGMLNLVCPICGFTQGGGYT
ncbi:MAG TPA: hypothetical protein VIO36_07830 [Anaerolineaceae bacterium]